MALQAFPREILGRRRFGPGAAVLKGSGGSQAASSGSGSTGTEFLKVTQDCETNNVVTIDLTGATFDDYAAFITEAGLKSFELIKTGTMGTEVIHKGAAKLTATRTFQVELSAAPAVTGTFFLHLTFSDVSVTS